MKPKDRVEVLYPTHWREHGTITRVVPRGEAPALVSIQLDKGDWFICDETLVKPLNRE